MNDAGEPLTRFTAKKKNLLNINDTKYQQNKILKWKTRASGFCLWHKSPLGQELYWGDIGEGEGKVVQTNSTSRIGATI